MGQQNGDTHAGHCGTVETVAVDACVGILLPILSTKHYLALLKFKTEGTNGTALTWAFSLSPQNACKITFIKVKFLKI